MKDKAYIGIDPGKQGAAAIITDYAIHGILDYPGDIFIILMNLREWVLKYEIIMVAIEKVSPKFGQGMSSTFTVGQNLGIWQGIISSFSLPYMMPTPKEWQKNLIDKKVGGGQKTRSLKTARRFFPGAPIGNEKDHGRADALLLALWAKRQRAH